MAEVAPKSVCDAPHPEVDKDSKGKTVYCPSSKREIIKIYFDKQGIDKEQDVNLKIEFNNKYKAGDELFINLDDCTDFDFELNGEKITTDHYLKITAKETQIPLAAKFKIQ